MDLESRLRAFAAVVRAGSFSGAARELYVSQPAVSKHIASLEAEVGRPLLIRDRKGVVLTPAGEVLADYVLRAEALLANARRALAAREEEETGTVSVAASGIPGTYLLPELLTDLKQRHRGIDVDLQLATSGGALELVRGHHVELAVIGGATVPPELEAQALVEDEIVLIGPTALAGRRLRASDLEGVTWITREEGSATRAAVDAARWQMGLHAVDELRLPSWEAVKLAVARGAGIAAISRFALDLELDGGTLAILDTPRWRLTRTISLVTARDVPLTPPTERFVQLIRERFGAVSDELPPNSNLPAPTSALVGRTRELDDLDALLRARATRLVTLVGAGGSGKTRLALASAARQIDSFRDGVYLVELAALSDPGLVLPAIRRALGLAEEDDVADALAARRVLLVLDNFEQVTGAAPKVAELLAAAKHLRVLVTSRTALKLHGERLYDVAPLPRADAVALFVERALEADPAFEDDAAVSEICGRLDDLPLAIELTAARVRTFPPPMLLERLDRALPIAVGRAPSLPTRQRTLRGTIEWSHDLLEPAEQQVFGSLAVFRGGWNLDAARLVCGVEDEQLEALVHHSLVRRTGERFAMLETVREYAAERLELTGDGEELRRRHADYVLKLARTARTYARGPHGIEWLDRTERELDNVRAALSWAIEQGEGVLGLELAEALEPYWYRRMQLREGLRWLEPLLDLGSDAPLGLLAGAHTLRGRLTSELGDAAHARPAYERGLELACKAGDRMCEAWALHGLGYVSSLEGDMESARTLLEQSLALFLELGEHAPAGGRLTYLAAIALDEGDREAARGYIARARDQYAAAGDVSGVVGATVGLAETIMDDDLDAALALYAEAVDQATEAADLIDVFAVIAVAACRLERPADAGRLWGAAEQIEASLDRGMREADRSRYLALLGPLDRREVAAGRALTTEEALTLARSVVS